MVLLDTCPSVSKGDLNPPEIGVWLETGLDHKLSLFPHRFKGNSVRNSGKLV